MSQPLPVPQQPWPGFQPDSRTRPAAQAPTGQASTGPAPSRRAFPMPATPAAAPVPPRAPLHVPAGPPVDRPATAEWTKLLRSFLPQPARRNWFREFRNALVFRGWGVRVGIPIVAMIILGVAVVLIAQANNGVSGPAPATASLGFPPATLAGGQFTAAASGRGINQSLGRVTSEGNEIVAVGAQAGARIARAQFFVSLNDGRSWTMGSVQSPDGGPPPPGHAARFVAGGRGAWVAIGPASIWTSPDGRTWTLSSTAGMPLLPGDQISVLKRTAAGFIAAGANAPGGNQARSTPVVFLSANGMTWQRLGAAQLRLAAGTGHVVDVRYAAANRNLILIAGDMLTTKIVGKPRHAVTVQASGAWLSSDGGTAWTPVQVPAGHGAQAQITGEAPVGDGFVLLRAARVGTRPAADVYRSPNGTAWTFEATLSTPAGFISGMVNGGPAGAVVTGQAGRTLAAFGSANGTSWQQTPAFGSAASQSVSGVSIAEGGAVVTGTITAQPDSRQPVITLIPARGNVQHVDIAKIPGAVDPQLAVNAVAAASGTQVAVGSANGFPAAWTSADGGSSWTPAVSETPPVLSRPGVQQLTSVTHGPAGWLAVGGVIVGTPQHPVVVVSADGHTWVAADNEATFARPGLFTEQAAAGRAGYVIVGYQQAQGGTIAAAWWSAEPGGWQRSADAAPGALDGAGSRQMLAVTASTDGFVAVGSHGNQPSAWTTPDGRNWRQADLPLPAGSVSAVLQHVASDGRTVVAVGTAMTTTSGPLPFAVRSSDGGVTWTQSALPVPAGHAFVTALAAVHGSRPSFTATGTFGSAQGHQNVVVWTSASGSGWKADTPTGQGLTGTGIQAITGLTVAGSTLTGVGFTASPAGEQPVFWQSPIR